MQPYAMCSAPSPQRPLPPPLQETAKALWAAPSAVLTHPREGQLELENPPPQVCFPFLIHVLLLTFCKLEKNMHTTTQEEPFVSVHVVADDIWGVGKGKEVYGATRRRNDVLAQEAKPT